jgi:N-methylhydantoinase B/oxoprolinase/acetone carboxylase alpha subunit
LIPRFEVIADDVNLALRNDRFRRASDGLFGGEAGSTGFCEIRRGGGIIRLRSKDEVMLRRGEIVTLAVGGGYRDLTQRAVARHATDGTDGYITAQRIGLIPVL